MLLFKLTKACTKGILYGGVAVVIEAFLSTLYKASQITGTVTIISLSTPRPVVYYKFLQGRDEEAAASSTCTALKEGVVQFSAVVRWHQCFEAESVSLHD